MKTIVASGHFAPLHHGHVQYLIAAKALGDRLIVIVNNDRQSFLKGSTPFLGELHRLFIVSQLQPVDLAMLSMDTDLSVCFSLRFLHEKYGYFTFANSGDVTDSSLVREASVCNELGISMEFLSQPKVTSSSLLLRLSAEWLATHPKV